MLTACCGLCRSFGPEVWIPNSRHLKSGKIAQYCNQKRTLFSIWVLHVEFHLWSAFPLNFTGQNQSKEIRRHLNWNAFRLESIFVPEHLYDFSVQGRNAMHAVEGHHWLSRETCLTLKKVEKKATKSLLCREEKISFQHRAGVLSEGLLHFNPVFVYQC